MSYGYLTDEQLATEISDYRAAYKECTTRQVAVVAGEGRRVEFIGQSGVQQIQSELRNLIAEYNKRNGIAGGGSLEVEIG